MLHSLKSSGRRVATRLAHAALLAPFALALTPTSVQAQVTTSVLPPQTTAPVQNAGAWQYKILGHGLIIIFAGIAFVGLIQVVMASRKNTSTKAGFAMVLIGGALASIVMALGIGPGTFFTGG